MKSVMRVSLIVMLVVATVAASYAKKSKSPERVARVVDPCEELVYNETTHLRAVGMSRSSVEKVARNEALRDARTQLAKRVRVAVEEAASDYAKSTNVDNTTVTQSISESVTTQYVLQYIDSSKPIKWSIYDLADGRVEVYVCVEMIQSEDASLQALINNLNQDDIINSKPMLDKFISKVKEGLDSYKTELRGE